MIPCPGELEMWIRQSDWCTDKMLVFATNIRHEGIQINEDLSRAHFAMGGDVNFKYTDLTKQCRELEGWHGSYPLKWDVEVSLV